MLRAAARGLAVGLLLLVAACGTTSTLEPQTKTQSPQQARIYILRDTQFMGTGTMIPPNITVDGQKVGNMGPGRYFFVDRDPGQHVVAVDTADWVGHYAVTLTLRPGAVYYVQVALRPFVERMLTTGLVPQAIESAATGNSGAFTIEAISEPAGRALLQKLAAG